MNERNLKLSKKVHLINNPIHFKIANLESSFFSLTEGNNTKNYCQTKRFQNYSNQKQKGARKDSYPDTMMRDDTTAYQFFYYYQNILN